MINNSQDQIRASKLMPKKSAVLDRQCCDDVVGVEVLLFMSGKGKFAISGGGFLYSTKTHSRSQHFRFTLHPFL